MIAGDQESKRPKFVLVQYNGSNLGGMAKSRAGIHKPGASPDPGLKSVKP